MPVRPTFPGVYIEEIPSGVRPITAVATSTAAFIGTFRKGLIDEAVRLLSVADFEREYGGLDRSSEASYAVQQFFLNGGTEAWVVRIGQPGPVAGPVTALTAAAVGRLTDFTGVTDILEFTAGRRIRGASASNPGEWGNFLRIEVEHNDASAEAIFNLFISEVAITGNRTTVLQTETFRNLTMEPDTPNYAVEVVNQGSRLIQLRRLTPLNVFTPPAANGTISADLGAAAPVLPGTIDDIDVTLTIGAAVPGMPVTLTIPGSAATGSFIAWAAGFQSALRNAGTDPGINPEHRAYRPGVVLYWHPSYCSRRHRGDGPR